MAYVYDPNIVPLPVAVLQTVGGGGGGGGGLTDAELRASPVPVTVSDGSGPLTVDGTVAISGSVGVTGTFFQATQPVSIAAPVAVTGTFFQATQPVSASSLPLPTGAATETTLSGLSGKLPGTIGAKTTALSLAVALPTDQAALHTIIDSGTVSLTGSISLPTGAATEATLAALSAKTPTRGLISTGNSSATPLGSNATFTGAWEDVTAYSDVRVSVFADQASATTGLVIQQSSDGINADNQDTYAIPATTGKLFSIGTGSQYIRIVYTNGAVAQGAFRLQTVYKAEHGKSSSVRPQDGRSNDNDMEEVLAYAMTFNGTSWDRSQSGDAFIAGQATQTAAGQNILLAVAGTGSTDTLAAGISYRSMYVQIIPTGTVSSGVVTFEGSNDGTTFVPIALYDAATITAAPATTISPATGVSRYMEGKVRYRYLRTRISTVIGGGGSLQAIARFSPADYVPMAQTVMQATAASLQVTSTTASVVPGTAATNLGKAEDAVAASGDTGIFALAVRRDALTVSASATGDYNEMAADRYGALLMRSYEKQARTYSAAAQVTAAATATDIFTITGSATTTVFITKIIISGIQTTAGLVDVSIVKRSTANTAGTSAAATAIPHDATDAAGTATCLAYSANPTTGTPVGTVRRAYVPAAAAATAAAGIVTLEFGERGRPVVLNGIAQVLAVNLGGATITGGVFDIAVEWFEI